MYRILVAIEDLLMRKALHTMLEKEEAFQVVKMVSSSESAVRGCKENAVNLVFMDMQLPGITGLEAGRIINRFNPEIAIYLLSSHATGMIIRNEAKEAVKDVLEKPITYETLKGILENYLTEHENSVQEYLEVMAEILRHKNFKEFYRQLPLFIDEIYDAVDNDSSRLLKIFAYLGQGLLDTRNVYDEGGSVGEEFPINEALILERKTSELWLFRIMDYLFRANSIRRYPLLENIFRYIERHIKEDITLSSIIENCAISQGYLSRIFREQFKVSVTEYLHMRKMHLAKGYFYFTEDRIAEVAFRLGYNESSYFSKVFKKFENMTVKEYKNKARDKNRGKNTAARYRS